MHRELAFAFHHIKMVLPRCWLHTAMAPADFSRQALLRSFVKKHLERPRDLLGQEHNEKGCPEVFTLQDTPYERRRLPTLPHCIAVPSAPAGLTSLFGMGRGGTPPQMPPDVRFRKTARTYAPTPYGDSLGTDKKQQRHLT